MLEKLKKNQLLNLCCQLSHELEEGFTEGTSALSALETLSDDF